MSLLAYTKFATPWRVPREWEGQTAVVMASGPSMTKDVADAVRASGHRTIVVNDQFRLAPWADILYAADYQWWTHRNNKDARLFAGIKVTLSVSCPFPEVMLLNVGDAYGLSDSPEVLNTCKNSGWQAINLAYLYGAKKIVLCGFDMRRVNGKTHNFGDHPTGLHPPLLEEFAHYITRSAPALLARGVDVVNTTPGSRLKCFRFLPLEEALCTPRS